MFRIAEACRIAVAVSVLVSMPAMARSVVIVAVANDVQRIVIRDAHDKVVSISKGDFVDGTQWRFAGVRGSTAMLESAERYKGARLEMQVTAGQTIDLGEVASAESAAGKK